MAATLSPQDYSLLDELNAGPRTISGNNARDGADRLVAAGYATSRNLNISVVQYEITQLGRIARVLKSYGLRTTQFSSVEPFRSDVDGLWRVKVTSEGHQPLSMDIGSVTKLVAHLRAAGAHDLANDFEREVERTRQFALSKSGAVS